LFSGFSALGKIEERICDPVITHTTRQDLLACKQVFFLPTTPCFPSLLISEEYRVKRYACNDRRFTCQLPGKPERRSPEASLPVSLTVVQMFS